MYGNQSIYETPAVGLDLWFDAFGDTPGRGIAEVRADYAHLGFSNDNVTIGPNNGLQFSGTGTAVQFGFWIPTGVPGAKGKDQFCEGVYLADSGIAGQVTRSGWAVAVSGECKPVGSGFNQAYCLLTIKETNQMAIQKIVNGIVTGPAAFAGPAIGQRVALTVVFGAGANSVEVLYDGVSASTFNDNVSPLQNIGLPALFSRGSTVGRVVEIGSLRCGILGRL